MWNGRITVDISTRSLPRYNDHIPLCICTILYYASLFCAVLHCFHLSLQTASCLEQKLVIHLLLLYCRILCAEGSIATEALMKTFWHSTFRTFPFSSANTPFYFIVFLVFSISMFPFLHARTAVYLVSNAHQLFHGWHVIPRDYAVPVTFAMQSVLPSSRDSVPCQTSGFPVINAITVQSDEPKIYWFKNNRLHKLQHIWLEEGKK